MSDLGDVGNNSGPSRAPRRRASLGSVSTGTLRPGDLAGAFRDILDTLDQDRRYARLIAEAGRIRGEHDDASLANLVNDLTDALNNFAPPYCYFGAHPGDGADFGYWPDWEAINADRREGYLASGPELPDDGSGLGQYLHISDHGNTELYSWDPEAHLWRSEWAVV